LNALLETAGWSPSEAEAREPRTARPSHEAWEGDLIANGYRFVLFDGLSRFYVAEEHYEQLGGVLSAPANVLDNFPTYASVLADERIERLTDQRNSLQAGFDHVREQREILTAQLAESIEIRILLARQLSEK
jgi:hypothetical protein